MNEVKIATYKARAVVLSCVKLRMLEADSLNIDTLNVDWA